MKQLLTLLITFLIASVSYAQSSDNSDDYTNPEWHQSGDVELGILIGYTSSTLTQDNEFDPDDPSGEGFLVGGQADLYLGKNWSLRGRLTYEQRDYGFPGLDDNYLAFSGMAAWHFGKNRRWHLQLGPAYSASLGDNLESGLGADFGIGVIIPIAGARFFIELDGVSQQGVVETTITDVNGNPIGTGNLDGNRSSLTFGLLF